MFDALAGGMVCQRCGVVERVEMPVGVDEFCEACRVFIEHHKRCEDGGYGAFGVRLIAAERRRQVKAEGWTPEHDDGFKYELRQAAIAYASLAAERCEPAPAFWPWSTEWWKPSGDEIRNLVKAGALIAAEIDRLQRIRMKRV